MTKVSKTQALHSGSPEPPPPSATDLMCEIENGNTDEALARIQELSRQDFIEVWRAAQTLEKALTKNALSWERAPYWGNGEPWPDEQEAETKAASA